MIPAIAQTGQPKRQLTLFDAVCIIIGIVIGAGIYETSPVIAASVTTPLWLILIWLLGGFLSLIGALCYAELTTAYPEEGGDYVFLTRAFGQKTGFIFNWTMFWIVRPANIGALSFIFARYANEIIPIAGGSYGFMPYAAAAVIILTLVNISGVRSGKWMQNILTLIKTAGLLLIVAIGLSGTTSPAGTQAAGQTGENDFYLAMILVLFTYGGWNNISYVAAEVIRPERNLLRSLITGIFLITGIYVMVNLAFLLSLGIEGMSNSASIASDALRPVLGKSGAVFISLLICLTCLNSINGVIFTESRVNYAMGREHYLYRLLGRWNSRLDAPVWSLVLQAIVTLVLIAALGREENAFERLVVFSAPLYWFFIFMVGVALFVFRRRHGETRTHFRVPLYPWLPAVFCLSSVFLLYASFAYAYSQRLPEAWWIVGITLAGVLISFYDPRPAANSFNNRGK